MVTYTALAEKPYIDFVLEGVTAGADIDHFLQDVEQFNELVTPTTRVSVTHRGDGEVVVRYSLDKFMNGAWFVPESLLDTFLAELHAQMRQRGWP